MPGGFGLQGTRAPGPPTAPGAPPAAGAQCGRRRGDLARLRAEKAKMAGEWLTPIPWGETGPRPEATSLVPLRPHHYLLHLFIFHFIYPSFMDRIEPWVRPWVAWF